MWGLRSKDSTQRRKERREKIFFVGAPHIVIKMGRGFSNLPPSRPEGRSKGFALFAPPRLCVRSFSI